MEATLLISPLTHGPLGGKRCSCLICVCFNYGSGGAKWDRSTVLAALLRERVCINLHLKREAVAPSQGQSSLGAQSLFPWQVQPGLGRPRHPPSPQMTAGVLPGPPEL